MDALRKKEGEYIRKMNCVNRRIAGITPQEYVQDNKEKFTKYHYHYKQDNKEKIAEQNHNNKQKHKEKGNLKLTCACGTVYSLKNKVRHNKSLKHQSQFDQPIQP